MAHALRFLTAGSVDDGKSTLIGRLLLDSRAILADQLDSLQQRAGGEPVDLSLLTDGLEAEREQGITIDVAYRYFATRQRKFIIADAPGHEQYTRNMVTAAAGSDAVVVLVDITKLDLSATHVALLPQTRRHALLAHLLRVPHTVFAVNKLDAVAEPGRAFAAVRASLQAFAAQAGIASAAIVPVSALRGDNVATPAPADWAWYGGPTLLQVLEGLRNEPTNDKLSLRLPVQFVARDVARELASEVARDLALADAELGAGDQPRTLWGRVAEGAVRVGDEVQLHPSGQTARVAALRHAGRAATVVRAGQSAGVVLDRHLDVSRGDWIGAAGQLQAVHTFTATLAWLDTEAAVAGRRYWLRHGHRWVQGRITQVQHRLNIHTLASEPAQTLQVNEIGQVVVQLQEALPVLPYAISRDAGALIVVDAASHATSGALLVVQAGLADAPPSLTPADTLAARPLAA